MANTASAALSSATETEEKSSSAVMLLLKLRTLIALIIVTAYFCIMAPNFISLGNLVIISKHVALTAFLAIGMTYVIVTGGIDLSVGAVMAIAGATTAAMTVAGHSLRAGYCTEAANVGVATHVIMEQTGHRSSATLAKYIRPLSRRKTPSLL